MKAEIVTRAWVWSGLEDLYFSFQVDNFDPFRPYCLFNAILGLEKILKGYLFFHDRDKYSALTEADAKNKIEKMAKKYGHGIKKMLEKASAHMPAGFPDEIKNTEFDGYTGSDMIIAVEAGYTELRYPSLKPIYEQFKVPGEDFFTDPLGSSGLTKFIYHVSGAILKNLRQEVDLKPIGERFLTTYGHRDDILRFEIFAFNGSFETCL